MAQKVRILGLDPGLRRTGWGVIESDGARISYVASGIARSDAAHDLAIRLMEIHDELQEVVKFYTPDEAAAGFLPVVFWESCAIA